MAKPVKPIAAKPAARKPGVTPKPVGFAKVDAIAEAAQSAPAAVAAPAVTVSPAVTAMETPAPQPAPVVEPPKTQAETVVQAVDAPIAAVADTVSEAADRTADAVAPATDEVASTVQKDVTSMATAFETPKAFGDINERAKGALEKGGKFVAEFGEFAKGNVEAVVESTRITAKGFESMGQDAADYTRKSFEGATANLRNLASVKSPTEFFKLHSDYVRSAFDDAVAQTSKSTEAFIKLAGDAAQPLSNRFAIAAEKAKTIA